MENLFFKDDNDRVDGIFKVTGKAKYFAEYELPGLTYGVLVTSTVTKGKITSLDTKAAEKAPGVIAVVSHLNKPSAPLYEQEGGSPMKIFYTNQVFYNGQPIAIVVANTFERATYAASLVKATYEKEDFNTDFEKALADPKAKKLQGQPNYKRGIENAYKTADVQVEQRYVLPIETHNPMELHGIIADWKPADRVTVYAKTQGVKATQNTIANVFKIPAENIQVNSEFVGGGFGMALRTWPLEIATVMASKHIGKPVKLVITRMQMFTMVGNRPAAIQKVGLGATKEGKLTGITHTAFGESSVYENFTEGVVNMAKFMYQCDNVNTAYTIVPVDLGVPIWMRGPGEATGAFALESAIDEMAHALDMDPLDFRIMNDPETDQQRNKPFSSKNIKEAYKLGAEKIGWSNRKNKPGSLVEGPWQTGYGVSVGVFNANRGKASVKGILKADGSLVLQSATSDIGPGTGTGMTLIANKLMDIPVNKITFELGDSSLPPAPSQGGSATLSTIGSAVNDVCLSLKSTIAELAANSNMDATSNFVDVLRKNNLPSIEVTKESQAGKERDNYSMYSFSIHFVQVKVNNLTGVVKVSKIVSVGDSGKIISPKTARSQMIGGAVGGIGMALTEEAVIDHRFGRYINNNFADYHVPVHADVPQIDVIFIDKPDPIINPMGAKGMGEIALIGFSAAVANAVFNATGKRIRTLPITPDKILAG
ncbi:xanthine dehydrogenase family protein molybdopterin-binding subunit [Pedobacter punctiformis]|uniref:Xanthine dehydrogenase family protein molybdopterin-binding subunit n=1 Tax=Pedobacter punctiformis TaxID=3004097 RepID=A0ABT4LAJ1_9SPHI|nr:xanthine dehydrogenase family protein molybdopterin-binding subunit [Pedobacter sp. HCMS5-2]MCZ4243824.1 xanthine dehydrogenase family protein molybdopterin-binding subunit [Pedobacter sp. HCMS5-2]